MKEIGEISVPLGAEIRKDTHAKHPQTRQSTLHDISSLQPKRIHHRHSHAKARTPQADMGRARIMKSGSDMSKRVGK